VRTLLRDILCGIRNVLYWLSIIWRDRDWDDSFFFEVMRHKIKSMERYFGRKRPIVVGSHKMARNIHRAALLLDRLIADNYAMNEMMFHEQKWGFAKIRLKDEGDYLLFDGFDYPNAHTEEQRELAEWERKHILADAEKSKQYDFEYLMHWLTRHLRCWWD